MGIGALELIIVLIIVLLIFGPGRIVKISRELGTSIRQFKQGMEASSQPDEQEKNSCW
jgi:sec-independent protein translocase protein TatA